MSVLIVETADYSKFLPIARTRCLWDITCGIYSPRSRWESLLKNPLFHSPRFDEKPEESINGLINSQYIPSGNYSVKSNTLSLTPDGLFISLFSDNISLSAVEKIENNDFKTLLSSYMVQEIKTGIFLKNISDIIKYNAEAISLDAPIIIRGRGFKSLGKNIFIEKTAEIQQYVSIQASGGPVIIDSGTVIRPFTIIDGPSYIGKNSLIDSAKIRNGTTIKNVCRVGGEVEASVIESYSNKHHEGFLGHSYVGEWVNIGAMATTSDLKNNYGEVKINNGIEIIPTGTNKFGSVIGDYSKIGIGAMLNTGTVISEGCNLFQENIKIPSYLEPFSWGCTGKKYEIDRFISDTKKIMKRRNVDMTLDTEKSLRKLYNNSVKEGF